MSGIEGKRAVVTGGAGFIGGHLVDELLAAGAAHVAVVDNFFLGKESNLEAAKRRHPDGVTVYREDAVDPGAMAEVMRREQPDVVFNLATKALLYSFFHPAGAFRVNTDIALTLAELLRGGAYGRLVHLSTSEVYGTAQRVPMDEDHPLAAETTYAAGKAAADLALASYQRMFDLDVVTLRPFNNYGPRQNEGALAAVIPLTMKRIHAGEAPSIQGDGEQTRDFIFVGDTVKAIVRMTEEEVPRGSVFNLGSGRETSILSIVRTLSELMGFEGDIRFEPTRKADVRRHCADVRAVESLIGPVAPTSLCDGLATTVDWFLSGRASS